MKKLVAIVLLSACAFTVVRDHMKIVKISVADVYWPFPTGPTNGGGPRPVKPPMV